MKETKRSGKGQQFRTVKSNGKIDYTCTVYEAEKNASFHRYVCIYSD